MKKLHPESLLNVPLIAQAIRDPILRHVRRGMDSRWEKQLRRGMTGFNPLQYSVYYAAISPLADWLKQPEKSARKLNYGDALVKQVLFFVHDYLHVWAYTAILELREELGFGTKQIQPRNVEDFAFCHILSEAVATVGLDYWFLCENSINDFAPIGTNYNNRGLTVSYQESMGAEYRRFCPDLDVQRPEFFTRICELYLEGYMRGFDAEAFKGSPLVMSWLDHEILYSEKQRVHIRQWLSYLSGGTVKYPEAELAAPILIRKPWQRALIRDLGAMLWEKVKKRKMVSFRKKPDPAQAWKAPKDGPLDLRFVNLNRIEAKRLDNLKYQPNFETNFKYFFYQFVSRHDLSKIDPELLKLSDHLSTCGDFNLVRAIFKPYGTLPVGGNEPVDLFLLP